MLKVLIRKELLDNFYSLRFMISSIICVFIIFASVFVLKEDYVKQKDAFDNSVKDAREQIKTTPDEFMSAYLQLMFTGIQVTRPPVKLQFLYTGVEKNPDRKTTVRAFLKPTFTGDININPVFPLFPVIDLLFIISIVMSLLAFVYTYDAVCGERERGTLKLLMSYAIPRDKVILAKWIGGYVSLIIPYVIGVFGCIIVILTTGDLAFNGEDWLAFCLTVLSALLFIAVMYSVGLFVSVLSKRSSTSISVLLLTWVVFVLVIPNVAPFVAEQLKPVKPEHSVSKIQAEISKASGDQIKGLFDNMLSGFEDIMRKYEPCFKWSKLKLQNLRDPQTSACEKKEQSGGGGQQASGGGGQSSGASSSSSGGSQGSSPKAEDAEKAAESAGMDKAIMDQLKGVIASMNEFDVKNSNCEQLVLKVVNQQLGSNMTMSQLKKMAESFGVKPSDINNWLGQCDSMKKSLIAELNSRKSTEKAGEQSAGTGQARPGAAGKPTAKTGCKKEYSFDIFQTIMPKITKADKVRATSEFYGSFLEAADKSRESSSKAWEDRDRDVEAQIGYTKNISRISPVSSFIYASTALADTGIEHEYYLRERYLHEYQNIFSKYIHDMTGMPYDKMKEDPNSMDILRKPPPPAKTVDTDLPELKYNPMSLAERVRNALPDMIILFVFSVLFFMAAFYSFLRAEIIE